MHTDCVLASYDKEKKGTRELLGYFCRAEWLCTSGVYRHPSIR